MSRQRTDARSILQLYRRLLAARRASPALHRGTIEIVDREGEVLVYRRSADGDERLVAVNFSGDAQRVDVDGDWLVQIASDGRGENRVFDGVLGPDQALVLQRAES